MADPNVVSDQTEYMRLAKEYADQTSLAKKAKSYLQLNNDLSDAKDMLSDKDMHDFAQDEISRIESELPKIEDEIKIMLIPEDPADKKDVIVEIRAAAGGDEAAIFAGDLYKMYERYVNEMN